MIGRWELPGSRRALARVLDGLRDGASVVLAAARGRGEGLREAVRASVRGARLGEVCPVEPAGEAPERALGAHAASGAAALSTAGSLAADPGLSGAIIEVALGPRDEPRAWWRFLAELCHAARIRAPAERLLLVVSVEGLASDALPAADAGLEVVRFDAWARQDTALWLAARADDGDGLVATIHRSLAAELAGGDLAAAEWLSRCPLSRLIGEPAALLAEWGETKGWTPDTAPCWEEGTAFLLDGEWAPHASLDALAGRTDRLSSRILAAQISTVLPVIERARLSCIERWAADLVLPWKSCFGVVERLGALELTHLVQQLGADRRLRSRAQRIEPLLRARNALSHAECLDHAALVELERALERLRRES